MFMALVMAITVRLSYTGGTRNNRRQGSDSLLPSLFAGGLWGMKEGEKVGVEEQERAEVLLSFGGAVFSAFLCPKFRIMLNAGR